MIGLLKLHGIVLAPVMDCELCEADMIEDNQPSIHEAPEALGFYAEIDMFLDDAVDC